MLAAFLLGLAGSFTHCVGMCSGVMLLLGRGQNTTGWRLPLLHAGRITTYVILGALAGALGYVAAGLPHHGAGAHDLPPVVPGLTSWQGALALLSAAAAIYMALALLGRAPSPELILIRVTRWWGRAARSLTHFDRTPRQDFGELSRAVEDSGAPNKFGGFSGQTADAGRLFLLGLFWGLLPCGLALTGLLLAAAAGSPGAGALTMLAFALGTLPMGLGVGWTAGRIRPSPQWVGRLRPLAAVIVLLFGAQMALRGLAAWGWVTHTSLGAMPLW